jgi:hypothetical protein
MTARAPPGGRPPGPSGRWRRLETICRLVKNASTGRNQGAGRKNERRVGGDAAGAFRSCICPDHRLYCLLSWEKWGGSTLEDRQYASGGAVISRYFPVSGDLIPVYTELFSREPLREFALYVFDFERNILGPTGPNPKNSRIFPSNREFPRVL